MSQNTITNFKIFRMRIAPMTNDINYIQLGTRLKRYRQKALLTQEMLADYIDVDTSAFAHAEKGASKPNLPQPLKVANTLNIMLDQLVCCGLPVVETYLKRSLPIF